MDSLSVFQLGVIFIAIIIVMLQHQEDKSNRSNRSNGIKHK